jgi:hypothetical protein
MSIVQRSVAVPALILALAAGAHAQGMRYPVSQRGTVGQTVAYTDISIAYGRPFARGRVLFGDSGVVKWDRIWHPGADSATRITFSRDVEIEGRAVKAGEYSIWLIPHAAAPWAFILSRGAHVFHTQYPGESNDALRVEIAPERGAYLETLTYYFPVVVRDSAVMRIHWGETFLPVRITAPFAPK